MPTTSIIQAQTNWHTEDIYKEATSKGGLTYAEIKKVGTLQSMERPLCYISA